AGTTSATARVARNHHGDAGATSRVVVSSTPATVTVPAAHHTAEATSIGPTTATMRPPLPDRVAGAAVPPGIAVLTCACTGRIGHPIGHSPRVLTSAGTSFPHGPLFYDRPAACPHDYESAIARVRLEIPRHYRKSTDISSCGSRIGTRRNR